MKLLIVICSFLAVFLGVIAAGLPFILGDSNASRLKAIRKRREALRKDLKDSQVTATSLRDRFAKKTLSQKLTERLRLGRVFNLDTLKIRMMRAGWRNAETPSRFLLVCIILPVLIGGYTAFLVYGDMLRGTVGPALRPVAVGGAALAAFGAPWMILKNAAQKRAQTLSKQFPDGLDLLLVCVEAGLSVEQSFMRITQEIGHTIPEISDELAMTAAELAFLGDRRVAFDNLVARTGAPEFKALATSLIQSERYGTSVANSLRVISEESRKSRVNTVEKKAASLGPKMTVPMICFILPCLFIVLLGPSVIILMTHK